ncbi:MAG: HDOD domain-containing protein [Desulfamplus sp.]|nr:HDOD domain-containing protein [Desulfamplus sp.]
MPYNKIMANIIAQDILDSGIKIPSLPASAKSLMDMIQMPVDKIEVNLLEKLIKNDPVLFVQILKLANSSYYSRGVKTTSLRSAIMRIGLTDTLHSLYMYVFKNTLPSFPQLNGFSDKEYWEEAWACAVANRRLGDPNLLVKSLPGELYIAGLLQGIGKLILAVYNPSSFEQCINIIKTTGQSLSEAELEIFGTTNSLVAYKILESWNLPTNICAAVGYWQTPESVESQYLEIVSLTQLACSIVRISGLVSTFEWTERASSDPFLTDLSNIYILRTATHPLVTTGKHYKIVQEIVSILEKNLGVTDTED